ncbi:hypothetical protein LCGC14_0706470 [marine sediment metagenome]|uniref:Uncharacterized protein n=1 Tax=marine sediment metagenome TaxID=412755 RepID=A0A0F9QKX2_9ZZZZ
MPFYAALDVAMEKTALCILDHDGQVVLETNVASDPDAIADRLEPYQNTLDRFGLEAGPLSEWLVRGLTRRGFDPCFSKPGMCGRPFRPGLPRPIVTTHAAWPTCCEWVGSGRST